MVHNTSSCFRVIGQRFDYYHRTRSTILPLNRHITRIFDFCHVLCKFEMVHNTSSCFRVIGQRFDYYHRTRSTILPLLIDILHKFSIFVTYYANLEWTAIRYRVTGSPCTDFTIFIELAAQFYPLINITDILSILPFIRGLR